VISDVTEDPEPGANRKNSVNIDVANAGFQTADFPESDKSSSSEEDAVSTQGHTCA